jgi:murein DD-endopeptidase MepM/ murein hydrolase activator NlpD
VRAVAAAALALTLAFSAIPAAASQADLERARSRANAAARDLAEATTRLAQLEGEIAELEQQRAATETQLTELQSAMKAVALRRYMNGTDDGVEGLGLDYDALRVVRADALARMVSAGNEDTVDQYREATEDLELASQRLAGAKDEQTEMRATLQRRMAAAMEELNRMERLEAERKAAEARQRAEAARREQAARASRSATTGRVTARPAASRPSSFAPTGSWMCPVQGPRAFTNDWGQPRSGGRRHQGTDILSPRGTPVVASVAGTVRGHNSRLGGISYYLHGDDGNTYFGTHLSSLSGASGRVSQGTVVGYVGDSGNARGGPTHLHFEIHPGGGSAVNPYPTLAQHC